MHAQVKKPKEIEGRAVSNSVTQKKSYARRSFSYVDNRPKVIAQRKLQAMADRANPTLQFVSNLQSLKHLNDTKKLATNLGQQKKMPQRKKVKVQRGEVVQRESYKVELNDVTGEAEHKALGPWTLKVLYDALYRELAIRAPNVAALLQRQAPSLPTAGETKSMQDAATDLTEGEETFWDWSIKYSDPYQKFIDRGELLTKKIDDWENSKMWEMAQSLITIAETYLKPVEEQLPYERPSAGATFNPLQYIGNIKDKIIAQMAPGDLTKLDNLAGGNLRDQHMKGLPTNVPLHCHIQTGSGGLAFAYMKSKTTGNITPIAYDVAGARWNGNGYEWDKGGKGSGPPGIPAAGKAFMA